ncbi:MAG: tyrosine-type recombinase/integrase [Thermomicrobiales bacterium]
MIITMSRLTDLTVRALPSPASGQVIHHDNQVIGFGVRVSQGGAKTFVLTYGKDRKRITLGRYPLVSLADAREEAKRKLALATLTGYSKATPLQAVIKNFLTDAETRTRPRTHTGYKRLLNRHLTLTKAIQDVTTRNLGDIFDAIQDTPQERAHLINVVKMLFRYAQHNGYISTNPAIGFKVRKPKPRKRVLTDNELKKIWNACPVTAYGTIVKLLILTGQRREEISHIVLRDGDLATIAGEFTKNHRDHLFPVRPETVALLEKDRTWGGWSKSKRELDKASGVGGYTLHDLRRTFRTNWAKLQLPREVAEKYINHVSGIQDPVEQTYDQHDYILEMRHNIEVYTNHVLQVVNTLP